MQAPSPLIIPASHVTQQQVQQVSQKVSVRVEDSQDEDAKKANMKAAAVDLSTLSVAELKEKCGEAGLVKTGMKGDLVARLEERAAASTVAPSSKESVVLTHRQLLKQALVTIEQAIGALKSQPTPAAAPSSAVSGTSGTSSSAPSTSSPSKSVANHPVRTTADLAIQTRHTLDASTDTQLDNAAHIKQEEEKESILSSTSAAPLIGSRNTAFVTPASRSSSASSSSATLTVASHSTATVRTTQRVEERHSHTQRVSQSEMRMNNEAVFRYPSADQISPPRLIQQPIATAHHATNTAIRVSSPLLSSPHNHSLLDHSILSSRDASNASIVSHASFAHLFQPMRIPAAGQRVDEPVFNIRPQSVAYTAPKRSSFEEALAAAIRPSTAHYHAGTTNPPLQPTPFLATHATSSAAVAPPPSSSILSSFARNLEQQRVKLEAAAWSDNDMYANSVRPTVHTSVERSVSTVPPSYTSPWIVSKPSSQPRPSSAVAIGSDSRAPVPALFRPESAAVTSTHISRLRSEADLAREREEEQREKEEHERTIFRLRQALLQPVTRPASRAKSAQELKEESTTPTSATTSVASEPMQVPVSDANYAAVRSQVKSNETKIEQLLQIPQGAPAPTAASTSKSTIASTIPASYHIRPTERVYESKVHIDPLLEFSRAFEARVRSIRSPPRPSLIESLEPTSELERKIHSTQERAAKVLREVDQTLGQAKKRNSREEEKIHAVRSSTYSSMTSHNFASITSSSSTAASSIAPSDTWSRLQEELRKEEEASRDRRILAGLERKMANGASVHSGSARDALLQYFRAEAQAAASILDATSPRAVYERKSIVDVILAKQHPEANSVAPVPTSASVAHPPPVASTISSISPDKHSVSFSLPSTTETPVHEVTAAAAAKPITPPKPTVSASYVIQPVVREVKSQSPVVHAVAAVPKESASVSEHSPVRVTRSFEESENEIVQQHRVPQPKSESEESFEEIQEEEVAESAVAVARDNERAAAAAAAAAASAQSASKLPTEPLSSTSYSSVEAEPSEEVRADDAGVISLGSDSSIPSPINQQAQQPPQPVNAPIVVSKPEAEVDLDESIEFEEEEVYDDHIQASSSSVSSAAASVPRQSTPPKAATPVLQEPIVDEVEALPIIAAPMAAENEIVDESIEEEPEDVVALSASITATQVAIDRSYPSAMTLSESEIPASMEPADANPNAALPSISPSAADEADDLFIEENGGVDEEVRRVIESHSTTAPRKRSDVDFQSSFEFGSEIAPSSAASASHTPSTLHPRSLSSASNTRDEEFAWDREQEPDGEKDEEFVREKETTEESTTTATIVPYSSSKPESALDIDAPIEDDLNVPIEEEVDIEHSDEALPTHAAVAANEAPIAVAEVAPSDEIDFEHSEAPVSSTYDQSAEAQTIVSPEEEIDFETSDAPLKSTESSQPHPSDEQPIELEEEIEYEEELPPTASAAATEISQHEAAYDEEFPLESETQPMKQQEPTAPTALASAEEVEEEVYEEDVPVTASEADVVAEEFPEAVPSIPSREQIADEFQVDATDEYPPPADNNQEWSEPAATTTGTADASADYYSNAPASDEYAAAGGYYDEYNNWIPYEQQAASYDTDAVASDTTADAAGSAPTATAAGGSYFDETSGQYYDPATQSYWNESTQLWEYQSLKEQAEASAAAASVDDHDYGYEEQYSSEAGYQQPTEAEALAMAESNEAELHQQQAAPTALSAEVDADESTELVMEDRPPSDHDESIEIDEESISPQSKKASKSSTGRNRTRSRSHSRSRSSSLSPHSRDLRARVEKEKKAWTEQMAQIAAEQAAAEKAKEEARKLQLEEEERARSNRGKKRREIEAEEREREEQRKQAAEEAEMQLQNIEKEKSSAVISASEHAPATLEQTSKVSSQAAGDEYAEEVYDDAEDAAIEAAKARELAMEAEVDAEELKQEEDIEWDYYEDVDPIDTVYEEKDIQAPISEQPSAVVATSFNDSSEAELKAAAQRKKEELADAITLALLGDLTRESFSTSSIPSKKTSTAQPAAKAEEEVPEEEYEFEEDQAATLGGTSEFHVNEANDATGSASISASASFEEPSGKISIQRPVAADSPSSPSHSRNSSHSSPTLSPRSVSHGGSPVVTPLKDDAALKRQAGLELKGRARLQDKMSLDSMGGKLIIAEEAKGLQSTSRGSSPSSVSPVVSPRAKPASLRGYAHNDATSPSTSLPSSPPMSPPHAHNVQSPLLRGYSETRLAFDADALVDSLTEDIVTSTRAEVGELFKARKVKAMARNQSQPHSQQQEPSSGIPSIEPIQSELESSNDSIDGGHSRKNSSGEWEISHEDLSQSPSASSNEMSLNSALLNNSNLNDSYGDDWNLEDEKRESESKKDMEVDRLSKPGPNFKVHSTSSLPTINGKLVTPPSFKSAVSPKKEEKVEDEYDEENFDEFADADSKQPPAPPSILNTPTFVRKYLRELVRLASSLPITPIAELSEPEQQGVTVVDLPSILTAVEEAGGHSSLRALPESLFVQMERDQLYFRVDEQRDEPNVARSFPKPADPNDAFPMESQQIFHKLIFDFYNECVGRYQHYWSQQRHEPWFDHTRVIGNVLQMATSRGEDLDPLDVQSDKRQRRAQQSNRVHVKQTSMEHGIALSHHIALSDRHSESLNELQERVIDRCVDEIERMIDITHTTPTLHEALVNAANYVQLLSSGYDNGSSAGPPSNVKIPSQAASVMDHELAMVKRAMDMRKHVPFVSEQEKLAKDKWSRIRLQQERKGASTVTSEALSTAESSPPLDLLNDSCLEWEQLEPRSCIQLVSELSDKLFSDLLVSTVSVLQNIDRNRTKSTISSANKLRR